MSTIPLNKLTELAQNHFDDNPELKEVYATQDGNIFFPNKLNLAKQHARVSNQNLHKISRSQVNVDDEEAEEEETPPTPPARKPRKKKSTPQVETLDPERRGE